MTTSADILNALRQFHALPGDAFLSEVSVGTGLDQRRIDALSITTFPSKGFIRTAYEIKVSRGDFLRDLKNFQQKQGDALRLSNLFYYATPPGLIQKEELPSEAGLIEIHNGKRKVIHKAPRRQAQDDPSLLASIMRRTQQAEEYHNSSRFQVLFHGLQRISRLQYGELLSNKWPLGAVHQKATEPSHPPASGMEFLQGNYSAKDVATFASLVLRAAQLEGPIINPSPPLLSPGETITCPNGHTLAVITQRIDHLSPSSQSYSPQTIHWYHGQNLPDILCGECGCSALRIHKGQHQIHVNGNWRNHHPRNPHDETTH